MAKFSTPLHTYQDGDVYVAVAINGENLVIGETRNEEAAADGHHELRVVMSLQDALAIAKAVMAQQAAEQAEEDAWLEEMYQRTLDRQALVSDALEHEIRF